MGLGGLSQALWLLIAFPPLQHRIGTGGVFRLCAAAWPLFFATAPICNLLLRHHRNVAFWTLGSIDTVLGSGVAMAFSTYPSGTHVVLPMLTNLCSACTQLSVNDIAPSHGTLGTLNALVLALSSGIRAVIPALSTSLYATGVRKQIFEGQLFWVIIVAVALGLIVPLKFLPEKAEGKLKQSPNSEA